MNTNEELQTIITKYGEMIYMYLNVAPVLNVQDYANDMIKYAQRIEYLAKQINYGVGHGNRRS